MHSKIQALPPFLLYVSTFIAPSSEIKFSMLKTIVIFCDYIGLQFLYNYEYLQTCVIIKYNNSFEHNKVLPKDGATSAETCRRKGGN
jgi:hypothetical protein